MLNHLAKLNPAPRAACYALLTLAALIAAFTSFVLVMEFVGALLGYGVLSGLVGVTAWVVILVFLVAWAVLAAEAREDS